MLDRLTLQLVNKPLTMLAGQLAKSGIKADHISICGFFIGMMSVVFICFHQYIAALICIVLNRLFDGLDGSVARINKPTDSGAYLDICLDFIFYSGVVLAFAIANPLHNSLAAAALIFSFIATGSTFLAFGIMAERQNITNITYPSKGFYYLGGLAEGTETFIVLILFCLLPEHFSFIAWIFTSICLLTAIIRIISGYSTLRKQQ